MLSSARAATIDENVFATLGRKVREVERKTGRKVLNFGPGTPDVPPSKKYLEALKDFYDSPKAHLYPGFGACLELQNGLIHWYHKRFGVELKPDELLPTLGGKDAIVQLALALFDEGDEVLVPNPGYTSFVDSIRLSGATPIPYLLSEINGFTLDIDAVKAKITQQTRAIWVNFPGNPTGATCTRRQLEQLLALCQKHDILIMYDHAYAEITYGGEKSHSILELAEAKKYAIEAGSFSKMYSFAGYRMGWIVGNADVIKTVSKVKSQMDSGLSLPLQWLGAYALEHPDEEWSTMMRESYVKRRDIVAQKLRKLGLTFETPQAALYIWARIPDEEKNSEAYAMRMLEQHQVLFTPGTAYGTAGKRHVRVSYCVNIADIDQYL